MKHDHVLVLGGGFAGLSAAIYLARAGKQVTLLEQHSQLGGKAQEISAEGFRFDTGPSVFTMPEVLRDIFRDAGKPMPLVLEPLEPLCRYFYPSGRVWDVHNDLNKTTAPLSPAEREAYVALRAEARKLYKAAAPTFLFNHAPDLSALLRYGLRYGRAAHPRRRLPQLLEHFGASPELQQFFLRFATYFGADPYRAPAVLHNIAWVELGMGVYYPQGGIYAVVQALEQLARQLGVTILTNTQIERLEVHSGLIDYVHSNQGSFAAHTIVSALDIVRSHQLLGKRAPQARLEPSLSGFVLLLGLEGESPELSHHNISFSADYPAEFRAIAQGQVSPEPTLYLSISSKSQPQDAPAGCENWFVMANAPANAPGAYWTAEQEQAYAERMLECLEARGHRVRERIRYQHILSPNHLAKLAHRGSIYGSAPHSLLSTLRPKQRLWGIDNLILAGGSVHPGGGIPLALLSGKYAAQLALESA